jgi:uncharacterized membrane protein
MGRDPRRVDVRDADELTDATDEASADADTEPKRRHRVRAALRWLFWRHLCFGGLAGALVFFCLSLTPSLLPRGIVLQGLISGITATIGYGVGSGLSSGIRKLRWAEPAARTKRIAWWLLLGATVVLAPVFLVLGREWQDDVRKLMTMDPPSAWEWGLILVVAVVIALVLLLISRLVRAFGRGAIWVIDRFLPRKVSAPAGVVLTIFVVIGAVQGFVLDPALSALNSAYSTINKGTTAGVSQPQEGERSGSPASLVHWSTLGVQGRDFTGIGKKVGPSVQQLTTFNGTPAEEPVRVYVGLESADSLQTRVDLALAELDRARARRDAVLVSAELDLVPRRRRQGRRRGSRADPRDPGTARNDAEGDASEAGAVRREPRFLRHRGRVQGCRRHDLGGRRRVARRTGVPEPRAQRGHRRARIRQPVLAARLPGR